MENACVYNYVTDDEAILKLMGAIINQAQRDYERALKMMKVSKDPRYKIAVIDLERFFLSDYGEALSFDHGEAIICNCKKHVVEGIPVRRYATV